MLLQCLILLLCGFVVPLLSRSYLAAAPPGWLAIIAVSASCGVALGFWIWRRGSDVLPMVPIMAACAIGVLIGYGVIAPADNPARGHRQLARQLERLVPSTVTTVRFFHEIDEGLWFYLRGHRLAPVPGSQPRYSNSYDKRDSLMSDGPLQADPADPSVRPMEQQAQVLLDWLRGKGRDEPYLLIRSAVYESMAPRLAGLVTPLYQETGLTRNCLILLHVSGC